MLAWPSDQEQYESLMSTLVMESTTDRGAGVRVRSVSVVHREVDQHGNYRQAVISPMRRRLANGDFNSEPLTWD